MGLLDKAKDLVNDNADKVDDGIDAAADAAKKVVPDAHDDKVDQAADAIKGGIDKLEK